MPFLPTPPHKLDNDCSMNNLYLCRKDIQISGLPLAVYCSHTLLSEFPIKYLLPYLRLFAHHEAIVVIQH